MENIYIIFSFLFGVCFGSFITLASYRLPKNEDIFIKKSYCPKCKKPLKFFSLIPIFSWIFQKGKCSMCSNKISIRYPLTEITTAILFILSYLKFGANLNTVLFDLIIVVCLIMFITDLETYTLPDSLQISLFLLSLLFIYNNNFDIFYSVLSSFCYFVLIYLVALIVSKWKKKDALGGGDLKFITVAGLILGIYHITIFLFLSGLIGVGFGLIWKKVKKNEYYPFAPALIISFLLLIFFM
ncbi:MAG TPA: prepilin peptidase [Rickettsiales bacterium]|nr:prepilin peptidase [Rickettsiales bacterium]